MINGSIGCVCLSTQQAYGRQPLVPAADASCIVKRLIGLLMDVDGCSPGLVMLSALFQLQTKQQGTISSLGAFWLQLSELALPDRAMTLALIVCLGEPHPTCALIPLSLCHLQSRTG